MPLNLTGPEADSLCTVPEADAWHERRGHVASWVTLDGSRKEELLRQAYDYLVGEFRSQWPAGVEFGYLTDGTIAPGARVACAVLALIAKDGPLDPEVEPQELESVTGPITTKYAPRSSDRRIFPAVERLMSPYLVDTSTNALTIKLTRG